MNHPTKGKAAPARTAPENQSQPDSTKITVEIQALNPASVALQTRMEAILQEFQLVILSHGIRIDTKIIPDGQIHRFHVQGDKPGSLNGWYILHFNQIAFGAFGSWRTGHQCKWHEGDTATLTIADKRKLTQIMNEAARVAEVLRIEKQHEASIHAQRIWDRSEPASDTHPYLARKGVKSHGLREYKARIVIPFYANGKLTTLQFIDCLGEKHWLTGGKKKTASFLIGEPISTVCVAEGYATGASVYQAKGYATYIAGDAGNLRWVAESVRFALPYVEIIICADNDTSTPGNPGVRKAEEAARLVRGRIAIAGVVGA